TVKKPHYPGNFPRTPECFNMSARASLLARAGLDGPGTRIGTIQDRENQMSKFAKESILLLSLFLIAATVQFYAESLPMALCFYFLPTLYSAYYFGRRHATLTAFASVFLVVLLNFVNNLIPAFNNLIPVHRAVALPQERLFDFAIWAGILAVTGYAMGTLYERAQGMTADMRESFGSLLLVLQHVIANEKQSNKESQRTVDASVKIAEAMGLSSDRIELLRSAVLLRDLSEL